MPRQPLRLLASIMFGVTLASAAFGAGESGGGGGGGGGGGAGGGEPPASNAPAGARPKVDGLFVKPEAKPGDAKAQRAVPACRAGYVLKSGTCVRVRAGIMSDGDLYIQGHALARRGFYEEALPILEAVSRTDDSMVYTMLGFTHRKLGRWDVGMALYEKALALNPRNVNAREYRGEAYVSVGRVDDARAELAAVEAVCGRTCEQYLDLARVIETGKPEEHDDDED